MKMRQGGGGGQIARRGSVINRDATNGPPIFQNRRCLSNQKGAPLASKASRLSSPRGSVHSKVCTKCRLSKPLTEFASRKDRPGTTKARCKKCTSSDNRKYPTKRPPRKETQPDTPHVAWLKKLASQKRKEKKATLDDAWIDKWGPVTHCPILGMPFLPAGTRLNGAPHPLTPSLDRIDPSAGYTPSNTRVVSYFANVSKNAWPEEQFRLLIMAAASNMRH